MMRANGSADRGSWVIGRLFITERTARTYVSNILGKLGLVSRTQAAPYAVEHKVVDGGKT